MALAISLISEPAMNHLLAHGRALRERRVPVAGT